MTDEEKWELLLDRMEAGGDVQDTEGAGEVPADLSRLGELAAQAASRRAVDGAVPDVDAAWTDMSSRLGIGDKARHSHRRLIAIAAALLVLFVAGAIYLFHPVEPSTDKVIAYQAPKAVAGEPTLTTASGKTVVLPSQHSNVTINSRNTTAQRRLLSALGLDADTPVEENVTLSMPSGNSGDMVLADGTHVWLYAGSTITYPVNFYGSRRVVYLQGQAHFEVHHDASRPFVIVTDRLNATVLGTELNVSCFKGEEAHVALLNGVVEVKPRGGSSVRLRPGEGATLKGEGQLSVAAESMEPYNYWKEGYLYFDDAPLSDIAAQFSRWYKVRVIFDDPRLRVQRYRFFCPRTEPVERAVELLNHFDNIKATLQSDGLHIK